ncbi:MAG: hypothetical protein H0T46_26865 [Deltaproteobacteria bacterium]|nr:hypothetical protein [Deltaproteobacteria bacterium]
MGSSLPNELVAVMERMDRRVLPKWGKLGFDSRRGKVLPDADEHAFQMLLEHDQVDPHPRTGRMFALLDCIPLGSEKGASWFVHGSELVRIADDAELAGPLATGLVTLKTTKQMPTTTAPFERYRRVAWLIELLANDSDVDAARLKRALANADLPPASSFAATPRAPSSELLYWLLRSLILSEDALFKKVLAVASKSKAPVLRSAITMVTASANPRLAWSCALDDLRALVRRLGPKSVSAPPKKLKSGDALAEDAFERLLAELKKAGRRTKAGRTRALLEESYGQTLPKDLGALVDAYATLKVDSAKVWGWKIAVELPGDDFESWVEAQQGEPETSSLCFVQHFANLVLVGHATDGDLFYAYVDPNDKAHSEVWWYDHEQGAVYGPPEADSLATLSLLSELAHSASKAPDEERLEPVLQQLVGKTPMRGHFREIVASVGRGINFEKKYEPKTPAARYFGRAKWVMNLLRDGYFDPAAIKKALKAEKDRKLPSPQAIHFAPEALYWLSRSFWLNKDAELQALIKLAKKSRLPIVRSAALTFDALQSGRRELGTLQDVHEVRRDLLGSLGKVP